MEATLQIVVGVPATKDNALRFRGESIFNRYIITLSWSGFVWVICRWGLGGTGAVLLANERCSL